MKTYQPKSNQVNRNWVLFDAKDEVLGRLATRVAEKLIGKHRVDYSTHVDVGDNVVVVNSEKIRLTGKKEEQKVYMSHSGFPGGLKTVSLRKLREESPEKILWNAVKGMLPDNRLKTDRLKRLNLVIGSKNPFEEKFK